MTFRPNQQDPASGQTFQAGVVEGRVLGPGKGVAELLLTVDAFRQHTASHRAERLAARQEYRLRELLARRFLTHVESQVLAPGEFGQIVGRIARREIDPYTAAAGLLARALGTREGTR